VSWQIRSALVGDRPPSHANSFPNRKQRWKTFCDHRLQYKLVFASMGAGLHHRFSIDQEPGKATDFPVSKEFDLAGVRTDHAPSFVSLCHVAERPIVALLLLPVAVTHPFRDRSRGPRQREAPEQTETVPSGDRLSAGLESAACCALDPRPERIRRFRPLNAPFPTPVELERSTDADAGCCFAARRIAPVGTRASRFPVPR
jgi:hypothetical protein